MPDYMNIKLCSTCANWNSDGVPGDQEGVCRVKDKVTKFNEICEDDYKKKTRKR